MVTRWPGEISRSEWPHVARCAARYIDRRPTRMEAVATKTAGFALFFIDYFVINASLPR